MDSHPPNNNNNGDDKNPHPPHFGQDWVDVYDEKGKWTGCFGGSAGGMSSLLKFSFDALARLETGVIDREKIGLTDKDVENLRIQVAMMMIGHGMAQDEELGIDVLEDDEDDDEDDGAYDEEDDNDGTKGDDADYEQD